MYIYIDSFKTNLFFLFYELTHAEGTSKLFKLKIEAIVWNHALAFFGSDLKLDRAPNKADKTARSANVKRPAHKKPWLRPKWAFNDFKAASFSFEFPFPIWKKKMKITVARESRIESQV